MNENQILELNQAFKMTPIPVVNEQVIDGTLNQQQPSD